VSFLDIDGLRFHVQRMGPKDSEPAGTVVLIHGLGTDSLASWYFTISPTLAAAGLDVVMYDQRGHGRSGRPAAGYQVERFVSDCEAVLGKLDVSGRVHVIGNCFGGTVAFGLAARRPELVSSILVIESEPATAAWAARMATNMGLAQVLVDQEETFDWITEHHGAHQSRLLRAAGRILSTTSLGSDLPDSQILGIDDLAVVDCPVLAVYGSESVMVPQSVELQAAFPGARVTFVAGQEHSVLAEAPEEVRELALNWLAEQGVPLRLERAGAFS
jgi:pimeloyl-ACP methyl ester carboxylesterase